MRSDKLEIMVEEETTVGQRGIQANSSRKSRTNDREGMDVKWEKFQGVFQKAAEF